VGVDKTLRASFALLTTIEEESPIDHLEDIPVYARRSLMRSSLMNPEEAGSRPHLGEAALIARSVRSRLRDDLVEERNTA
jgi:hypothetical protein